MHRIIRYEPTNFLREINKLFEQAYPGENNDLSNADTSQWMPAVDIKDEGDKFIILADLPGIDKNDIKVSMEHHVLTIKGERKEEKKEEKENYSRIERSRGTFYRRFTLPDTADGEKIHAKMQNGVLEIVIPKKENRTRQIDVKIEE